MRFFDSQQVADALPWSALLAAIEDVFLSEEAFAPMRTAHTLEVPGRADAALLLKPGWIVGDVVAVKVVTFFPENSELELPTVNAGVLLFDGTNGTFLGACDGNELTARRTAGASAVAANRLARKSAQRLLVVGTGALGPMAAQAHCAVRSYQTVGVWGRRPAKAAQVVSDLRLIGLDAIVVEDLDEAVTEADVISCVTGATTPVIKGTLLKPGVHVDLIGSFTAQMRETDDDVIRRSNVWVDTRGDAMLAGDLAQPIESGLLAVDEIQGDLAEIVAGTCPLRTSDDEITLFKSAGTALEDVAAAKLIFD